MKHDFNKDYEEQYEDVSVLKTAFGHRKSTLPYWKAFSNYWSFKCRNKT